MHMLKPEVAQKLQELITPMEGCRILEIGTGWAESAVYFSKLKPDWKIYTVDAFGLYGDGRIYSEWDHEKILAVNKQLQDCGNVIQLLGNSSTIPWELPIDVLFLDGDHTYEGVMADFLHYHRWLKKGGIVCFDDYTQENNPNNGVKRVVNYILYSQDPHMKYELIHKGYYAAILKKL
jgi:predicted O-methyltransferase YrrM